MNNKHRILVMAHGHPDFSVGGGEIAAYNLFKAYRNNTAVDEAWFLARADRGRGITGAVSLRRANEYLWEQGISDWYFMKASHQRSITLGFADLIRAIRPTVVHTHHYAHFGLEFLRVIKQIDPSIYVVMTLHEYMAICNNRGQMIKTGQFRLCTQESFDDCRMCFPDKSAEDFWLRKHYFMRHFDLADRFVAPSEFLRQRYIQWGLDAEKVVVIENGQADVAPLPPRLLSDGETRNRFGYFGQINPYKGIVVVLKALRDLPKSERKKIVFEVHGANLEVQSAEFREEVDNLSAPLIKQGVVQWIGAYQPHELPSRMAGVDWVVVPSIWWENSPMVIQEAFVCGRPLLVSNIGGMAEKVRDGVDGLHVPVANVFSWIQTFRRVANDATLWDKLVAGIVKPITHSQCAQAHIAVLERAL